jgi:hypothetical protein
MGVWMTARVGWTRNQKVVGSILAQRSYFLTIENCQVFVFSGNALFLKYFLVFIISNYM